jgi:hypothetical protein
MIGLGRRVIDGVRFPDVRTACETYTDFVHHHLVNKQTDLIVKVMRR